MSKLFARCPIHPSTIKYIKKGHPWVTMDSFTERFPKENDLIVGINKRKEDLCLLIHDPQHSKIKARVWSLKPPFQTAVENFWRDVDARLVAAFEKRARRGILNEREDLFWVFGEADFLPGLFILGLKNRFIIQTYCGFWDKKLKKLREFIHRAFKKVFPGKKIYLWYQKREQAGTHYLKSYDGGKSHFTLSEFGLLYKIKLDCGSDTGIYPDMASVRKKLDAYIADGMNILNLYSYTGAFSLFALKKGGTVTSVDLSSKYLSWLNENLDLNPSIDKSRHHSLEMASESALKKLRDSQQKFDFIICDPPSFSSDGRKSSKALHSYEALLLGMFRVLGDDGKMLICLNTHTVSWKKFEDKVMAIISKHGLSLIIRERWRLGDDCMGHVGFPEGDYLKCLLLSR